MGDAILSILLELCKLLPFLSVCPCNVQICFPGKTFSEQVEGGDGAEQNARAAWRVETGVWEPAIAVFRGEAPPWKPVLEMLSRRLDVRDAECQWSWEQARGAGTQVLPQHHTSLPAPALLASSSSGCCTEKNIVGLLKRLRRAVPARDRVWQGDGAMAMSPSVEEPPLHTRCGSTCRVGWRSF